MNSLDTLHIWNGLELAKDKAHPYGKDIAEVYALHFLPENPDGDPWIHAGRNLYYLLTAFCYYHGVQVTVDGRIPGDWMNNFKFIHKCDVRVFKDESSQLERKGSGEAVQENGLGHYALCEREEKELYPASHTKRKVRRVVEPDRARELVEELEECKITVEPKRNTEPRLPNLLRNLWRVISSPQNKKMAL